MRALATLAVLGALALPGDALARDDFVTSFDGTQIAISFMPASGLSPGGRAPTVLHGHGWGASRDSDPDSRSEETFGMVGNGDLRAHGFNVLSWDARGFGESGGTVHVDSPEYEGRDVQALIDYVAVQPEAALDAPDDPRLGMVGSSYGGGIQLTAAGLDGRIDTIVPNIAWHSLLTSLYKHATVKAGWGAALFGVGSTAYTNGFLSPAGAQTGGIDPAVNQALVEGASTGRFSDETAEFFASRGPGDELVGRIRVPVLLTQGTTDTLFTLQEAIDNYLILRRNGVTAKMLWFCGGHVPCTGEPGPSGHLHERVLAWLDRFLGGDRSVDVGPGFEWLADDGVWRSSPAWPLPAGPPLRASGSGVLPLSAGDSAGGTALFSSYAANAVNVAIPAPPRPADVAGAPRLRLVYEGLASDPDARIFAHVIDADSGRVLGGQVTPIPIVLDGERRVVTLPLEPLAGRAEPDSRWVLQVFAGSNVYGPQRANGAVTLSDIDLVVPIGRPFVAPFAHLRLLLGRLAGPALVASTRRWLLFRARSFERLRAVRFYLHRGRRIWAISPGPGTVDGLVRVPLRRLLPIVRGPYRLTAIGINPDGRRTYISRIVGFW